MSRKIGNKKVPNSVKVVSVYDVENGKIISKDPTFNFSNGEYPEPRECLNKKYSFSLKFKQGSLFYGYFKIKLGKVYDYVSIIGNSDINELFDSMSVCVPSHVLKQYLDGNEIVYREGYYNRMLALRVVIEIWIKMTEKDKQDFIKNNPKYFPIKQKAI